MTRRRSLSYWAFAIVVVVYLGIIQLGGVLFTKVIGAGDTFTSTKDVVVGMWIPLAVALAFVVGVIMLRDHGLTKGKVALWSSVIFGPSTWPTRRRTR